MSAAVPSARILARWLTRLDGSRTRVLLVAALLFLLLAVIVVQSLRLEQRREVDAILDQANRSAQKLAARTTEVLDRVSQTTLLVRHLRETGNAESLQSLRAGGVLAHDVTLALMVSDARGFVTEATSEDLPLNMADEAHFKRLRDLPPGAVDLGVVELQPGLGFAAMPLSRRLSGRDGAFAGVVTALIPPTTLVAGRSEARGTALSVVGLDSLLRARWLDGQISHGDRLDVDGVMARVEEVRRSGLPSKSRIDGVERFVVALEVERYPLLVVVAVDAHEALADYRRSRNRLLAWAPPFGLLLLAGTAYLLVQARRLDLSRARQREAEAGLRATFEGSLDSVAIMRAVRAPDGSLLDLLIVDANARAAEFIGRGEVDVIGKKLCELAPSIRSEGHLRHYEKVIATRRPSSAELQATDPHLAGRWLHHQVVAVGDGIALISRDVSERRQAAQALAEQRNFLQNLLDYLPLPVYAKSARAETRGRYLFWNRAAERSFHMGAAQVVGKTVQELFPAEVAARFDAQDAQIIGSGEPARFAEQVYEGPEGRRYIDSMKVPVRGADGSIDHVLVIAEDITERREQAKRLRLGARVLAEMAEAVLISDASAFNTATASARCLRTSLVGLPFHASENSSSNFFDSNACAGVF